MSDERIWTDGLWAGTWAGASSSEEAERTPADKTAHCYRLHGARVFRTVVRCFPRLSHADIEDAVQFAFMQYFQETRDGRLIKDAPSWLTTVARNKLRNHIERETQWGASQSSELLERVSETLTDETTVDDQFTYDVKVDRYEAAVQSLPPFERRCFVARLSNLKLKEIAAKEGVDLRRVAEAIVRAADHITRYINEA